MPQYLKLAGTIGIQQMAVVQASIYGTDNTVTLNAIAKFGLHQARDVAVIDDGFGDQALRRLHQQGVRSALNMVSGNGTPEDQMQVLARRLAPLDWHFQGYANGHGRAKASANRASANASRA